MSEALRRTAVVCLLGAAACGGGGRGGSMAAPTSTVQAVVFDAADDPFVGVLVPYAPGVCGWRPAMAEHTCPPNAHVAPGGVAAFDPDSAATAGASRFRSAPRFRAPRGIPRPPTSSLGHVAGRLRRLGAFAAVDAWLTRPRSVRRTRSSPISRSACRPRRCCTARSCRGSSRRKRRPKRRIGTTSARLRAGQQGRPLPDTSSAACSRYVIELDGVTPLLDALRFDRARCEDVVGGDAVGDRRTGRGALRLGEGAAPGLRRQPAPRGRGLPRERPVARRPDRAGPGAVRPDDVKASCANCEPVGAYRRPPPAGTRAGPLERGDARAGRRRGRAGRRGGSPAPCSGPGSRRSPSASARSRPGGSSTSRSSDGAASERTTSRSPIRSP